MSIKSIPLKTWEVQATLDNRKSTLRRVVKPHNSRKAKLCEYTQGSGLWVEDGYIKDYSVSSCWMKIEDYISKYYIYKPGDVLWVREKWRMQNYGFDYDTRTYQGQELQYRADLTDGEDECYGRRGGCAPCRWSPSIHMPKSAARLFLRVKSVRVERLQAMDVINCVREGATWHEYPCAWTVMAKPAFIELWDSTIKPADLPLYGWDANPWVWVIKFERCEKPEEWI